MSVGEEAAEAPAAAVRPKPSSRGVRLDRLLSGLGAGPLVDIEPDTVKGEIRRWARAVATLVRQLSFGAWPDKGDGSPEQQGAGDGGSN
ncbi:hypothetical protein GUJ93_ZPchr0001g30462 [Zizania palustris]|uniref:Uncharacterized protein n=1 Tax=Zizania palustris TaxID=103762 RepID=A0A8J5SDR0_ZIZPA|nr:hypothetical protein GUJ93_ZPchr0001g30462 [Zizania palustris]